MSLLADPPLALFDAYRGPVRERLLELRALILEVAAGTEGVGPLEEALRWGEPAYLTTASQSGSTIRLNAVGEDRCALYFNCKTRLLDTFRGLYPNLMTYEGDRAILLGVDEPLPREALAHCIALALTYHRWKAKAA